MAPLRAVCSLNNRLRRYQPACGDTRAYTLAEYLYTLMGSIKGITWPAWAARPKELQVLLQVATYLYTQRKSFLLMLGKTSSVCNDDSVLPPVNPPPTQKSTSRCKAPLFSNHPDSLSGYNSNDPNCPSTLSDYL